MEDEIKDVPVEPTTEVETTPVEETETPAVA